jgi:hypothetical protein
MTKGPMPPVALGTRKLPFTRGQQIQRGAQAAYGAGSRAFGGIVPPFLRGAKNLGSKAKSFGGRIPKAGLAFGGIDAALRIAQGQNAGQALGGAASSMAGAGMGAKLGAGIGTFITPGIGTTIGAAIGTVAGGILGDKAFSVIYDALMPSSNAQMVAAQAQKDAAAAMRGIPTVSDKDVGPVADYAGAGAVGIGQLGKAFKYAGLEGDKSAQTYMTAAGNLANLRQEYQRLNDLAAAQKASSKRVDTTTQAQLDAARASLVAGEKQTAAAWDKITKTNKDKINNAIVQMQTNTTAFTVALSQQSYNVAKAMQEATARINAAKLTPDAVKNLSNLLPPVDDKPPAQLKEGGTKKSYKGHLGDAIASEMKHKPPGSNLVIANSSETIIPADGLKVRSAWSGMGSGPITVNAPITVYQQPGEDGEALANRVATLFYDAMNNAQSASIFG